MKQISRVLCVVDIDDSSRATFRQALAIARGRDSHLVLVCAVPPDQSFNHRATERVAYLLGVRAEAAAAGVPVFVNVQTGETAEIVTLTARAREVDVIVVSAGHGAGDGRARGSVAEDIVRHATCATLVVRNDHASPVSHFASVVAAVDVLAPSTWPVSAALPLLDPHRHRLTLLHVIKPAKLNHAVLNDYHRHLGATALERLQALIPPTSRGAAVARVVVGDVAREITSAVNAANADLLVLGARFRNRLGRRLFGATRQLLVQEGCPVLAIPVRESIAARDLDERRRAA